MVVSCVLLLLGEDAVGVAADVFSFGVTLVEVASGRAPGEQQQQRDFLARSVRDRYAFDCDPPRRREPYAYSPRRREPYALLPRPSSR